MAIKCVNVSHPEFKSLLSRSGMGSFELELAVSDWQAENNSDSFPTLDQLPSSTTEPVEVEEEVFDAEQALLETLNKYGIAVTSMKEYADNYEIRNGEKLDIKGLADTARGIIAIDKTGASETTLSEEAAHMAVASQVGSFDFNRAMRLVEDTQEYKQELDKLLRLYNGDMRKAKMEILGRLMADKIFNGTDNTRGTGLAKYLRRLWNKFLAMFGKASKELDQIIDKWTGQFVSGTMDIRFNDEGVFFDADMSEGEELYAKVLEGLRKRIKYYEDLGAKPETAREGLNELYDMAYTEGILKFLKNTKDDVKRTSEDIKRYLSGEEQFTAAKYRDMKLMLDFYQPYVSLVKEYFEDILVEDGVFTKKQIKKAKKQADAIFLRLEKIDRFHKKMGKKLAIQWAEAAARDSITDPAKLQEELSRIRNSMDAVDYDSNKMLFWFGSLVHGRDSLQRALYYTINKIRRQVQRFAYDLGKSLTQKAEELGIRDTSRFIEKDADGKFTHYFLDKFKNAGWKQAQDAFHYNIHEKYGVPQDRLERAEVKAQWREAVQAVEEGKATEEQIGMAEISKMYNQEVAQWYSENTMAKPNWNELIQAAKDRLGGGTSDAFKEWKRKNIGVSGRGTPYEIEYPKGELAQPSDGSVRKRGQHDIQTVDWTNPQYDKLSAQEKEMLALLIKTTQEANQKQHRTIHPLQIPQIKASTVDLLKQKKFSGIMENIKDVARDAEDDTIFGDERTTMRPDGTVAQFVPVYFTKQLENPEQLSPDLLSSVIAYSDVMENYSQMSKQAPALEAVMDTVGRRIVTGKRKQFLGNQSEVYKSMEKFIEMNVYGKMKNKWMIGNVNMTKIMQGVVKYVTANNLAFSLYTTLASYFNSAAYSKIEDLVGQYTTQADKIYAEKIWDGGIHRLLLEAGKINKTNKLGLFFEKHRIMKSNHDVFNNLDKSRLTRKAIDSGLYWSYELVKLRIRGKLALAIASNYRYHEGTFKTKSELKAQGVENIKDLPTYYDMVEVQDGKLIAKHEDPNIEDIIERKVNYIGNNIDGELNFSDWAAAHQGAVTQLVTTHRGWLFRNIQLRLKPKGINYETGHEEQGYYLGFAEFIRRTMLSPERVKSLKGLIAEWQNLNPTEKQAVLRNIWEIGFIWAVSTLALIVNNAALDDDEDDSLIQYLAYQSNRVLLELAVMNPTPIIAVDPFSTHEDANGLTYRLPFIGNLSEMTAILNSPVAATRQLDNLMDLSHVFSNEEIQSGPYEGMTKRERMLLKALPGVKGMYQLRDPKSRNQFLKNKTLRWLYD